MQEVVDGASWDTSGIFPLSRLTSKYRTFNLEAARICAEAAYKRTLKLGQKKYIIEAEIQLAITYTDKSDFVKATLHLTNAEKLCEEIGDDEHLLIVLNSLGNCYSLQDQSKVAVGYYRRALTICDKLGKKRKMAVIMGNIGNLYYRGSGSNKSYLDTALVYYYGAFTVHEAERDTVHLISSLGNQALVLCDKRDFATAREKLSRSIVLIRNTNNVDALISYYNTLARILSFEGKKAEATVYLDSCEALARRIGSVHLITEVYISRSDNAAEAGDFKAAYEYHVKYTQLSDSILNADNFARAADIQNMYEREKKQREIEKLTLRNQNQVIIITSIIVFFIALVVFALIIYRRLQENRKQKSIIEQQRNEMLDSIHYAKRIQTALLASDTLLRENLSEFFILYKPKDIVSGDFYWAAKHEGKFIFCLGDCTGHGVPGAFMSLLNISKLNETINEKKIIRPDLVLNQVRSEIINALNPNSVGEAKDGMDCSLCSFDFKNLQLQYAAANNGLVVVREKDIITLPADRMPVGKSPKDAQPFSLNTFQLQKGDIVYLFTDGYADQFGGETGKKFKIRNLYNAILSIKHLPMAAQKENLERLFEEWRGNLEQVDDVAIAGIQI